MVTSKKEIFFFIRAYNDIDIQLSLIREYAEDKEYFVRVIFYPADGFITHHDTHEATQYMQEKYNIKFESILQNPYAPFILRKLYTVQNKIRNKRKCINNSISSFFLKVIDVFISKIMRLYFSNSKTWLIKVAQTFNPSIIVTDEIQFQPNRSFLIDELLPKLKEKGAATYAILTGHRVYKDVYPAGEPQQSPQISKSQIARIFFVPSEHNRKIYKHLFSSENIIVGGNLRMDNLWIETLHKKIIKKVTLPEKKVKIVIMLSKMNYGVDEQKIKDTIQMLGAMPGIALAIKPHTRGMKFDFMTDEEIGHAHIVDDIPSTALIEWCNVTLMTGSSIVFHALIRQKKVGFLKYCQSLETIFDHGSACKVYNSLESLEQDIKNLMDDNKLEVVLDNRDFIKHEIHGGVDFGATAKKHKDMIAEDYANFLATQ